MNTINTYYTDGPQLARFVNEHHDFFYSRKSRFLLVQIFSGVFDRNYLLNLMEEIEALLPKAKIIGTTTSGEIMDGKVSVQATVLSFSSFEYSKVRVGFRELGNTDSFALGRAVAHDMDGGNARLLLLFSAGKLNQGKLLKGVESVSPSLPVAGGVAGDDFKAKLALVICSGGIVSESGIVGAVLESRNLQVYQYWHLCWTPIGKEMTITKAEGSRVYTIDHVPAYQIYKKYLGLARKSTLINYIFPLFSTVCGIDTARHPFDVYDDESIEFCAEMNEGERVRFSYGHVGMILKAIDRLTAQIKSNPAESIFVYSCALRRGFLQENSEIETEPLQSLAPTAGFFTNGEFFHKDKNNHLLHATMTTLVLSETDVKCYPGPRERSFTVPREAEPDDSLKAENLEILKALTNLVNTVTNELAEKTSQLERADSQIKYASSHDAVTGLYNRSFYEQKIAESERICQACYSIVICDVDGLKLINDSLGHSAGDKILKSTAKILRSAFGPKAFIARIGGDEFSALLPGCSLEDAKKYCVRIHESVRRYNTDSRPMVPLSISVGCSGRKNSAADVRTVFREADFNMYQEKLLQSKSIHTDLVLTVMQTLEEEGILTQEQCSRNQSLTEQFANFIDYPSGQIPNLKCFARFYDVGKIGVSNQILFKPATLMPKEIKEMQRHSEIGFRIAQASTMLFPIADWILKHHEWWNGKGYPLGLYGKAIPLECRIISIVGSYCAMTSDRPFRKAMSREEALEEIRRYAGIQFDPTLARDFIRMMENNEAEGSK